MISRWRGWARKGLLLGTFLASFFAAQPYFKARSTVPPVAGPQYREARPVARQESARAVDLPPVPQPQEIFATFAHVSQVLQDQSRGDRCTPSRQAVLSSKEREDWQNQLYQAQKERDDYRRSIDNRGQVAQPRAPVTAPPPQPAQDGTWVQRIYNGSHVTRITRDRQGKIISESALDRGMHPDATLAPPAVTLPSRVEWHIAPDHWSSAAWYSAYEPSIADRHGHFGARQFAARGIGTRLHSLHGCGIAGRRK